MRRPIARLLTLAALGGIFSFAGSAQGAVPEYIVQFDPSVSSAAQRLEVDRAGGAVTRDLHLISAVGARLDADARETLEGSADVVGVTPNAGVEPAGWKEFTSPSRLNTSYVQSVKADKVWDDVARPGAGVTVAVVDSGIAGGIKDFEDWRGRSRVIASVVTNPDATTAEDTYGHGTHVAGIIGGDSFNRWIFDRRFGSYRGTAPAADLVSVKVSDDEGATSMIDVVYGMQFVVDNKDELDIRVVNLSLTASEPSSYKTDPLAGAVEAAWNAGIVVVTAAGNRGATDGAVDYSPANDPYAITVGAVDDQGTHQTGDDRFASWSSRGVTVDGYRKADVVAPGAHMISTLAPDSAFESLCPTCVVDGNYFQAGGTSMAAPVVSGVVALIIQQHPNWTPDMVKTALMATLRQTADGRDLEVNAAKAVDFDKFRRTANPNLGLTPSTFIDEVTGALDPTRASWSRASWSGAAGLLRASWSRASWSCVCDPLVAGDEPEADAEYPGEVDPTRASWSRASWSRASWSTDWNK